MIFSLEFYFSFQLLLIILPGILVLYLLYTPEIIQVDSVSLIF